MVELRVVVRAASGRVVMANIAPDKIGRLIEMVEDTLPCHARFLLIADKARYIAKRIQDLMLRNAELDDALGQAIVAMALFFADLKCDDRWWRRDLRRKIEGMLERGWSPILAVGLVRDASVTVLSGDHVAASDQLAQLVERLALGDTDFVQRD